MLDESAAQLGHLLLQVVFSARRRVRLEFDGDDPLHECEQREQVDALLFRWRTHTPIRRCRGARGGMRLGGGRRRATVNR